MKKSNYLNLFVLAAFIVSSVSTIGQGKYYNLTATQKVKTAETKDIKRTGSCWSNAGAAFLEAEWLRTGKEKVDISMMDFIHNAYLLKAEAYLASDGETRVGETGIAYDVIALADKYGFVPESAYMYPDAEMMDPNSGEMDAILRGTLRLIQERENGEFTDKWQNTYNTALLRYVGESKIEFDYNGSKYTPLTFAEFSGLSMDDYIMLTSDAKAELNTMTDLDLKYNWAGYQFKNVSPEQLVSTIKSTIGKGYPVLWYGSVDEDFVFAEEHMAIVPVAGMPQSGAEDQTEDELKPIPEKVVTSEMRSESFADILAKDQDYLLIYGISTDQDGNTYFEGKYVCKAGDLVLNMSEQFVKLNTIYLMLNKNGM